jgi:hypothetical protein
VRTLDIERRSGCPINLTMGAERHGGASSRRHLPVGEELSIRAQLLEEGGAPMWGQFMDELCLIQIKDPIGGADGRHVSSVPARLAAAYERARTKASSA